MHQPAEEGSFEDQNMVRLEVVRLRHHAAHLKRRHEALIERVAAFPNTVNTRQEKEVRKERSSVDTQLTELEGWLDRWAKARLTPA
jgi:hypothetical protein